MNKVVRSIRNNEGYELIRIEVEKEAGALRMKFKVISFETWNMETMEPGVPEKIMEGELKWDACIHVWFGDDGYIHDDSYSILEHMTDIFRILEEIRRELFPEHEDQSPWP